VDAFPTRPLHGSRILRFFTNINPKESRHWMTSLPFDALLQTYGGVEVPFSRAVGYSLFNRIQRKMKQTLRSAGMKIALRSPYDKFMLRFHNFLKENAAFQADCPKDHWEFPPNCCWAVFTDQVSHAAMAGQYALEQTFLIPIASLLYPEKSPLHVLQRRSGRNLIDTEFSQALSKS
ncbi:MAG TPA: Kdo hydroxylase family protein, partial [Bdellovibrionota bacterium]|nr:Kdo hydroxylase family protein [Bdellovibrionota bacterium]